MCERREKREERKRERVNNIKKNVKKEESSRTKKAKIYLRTKDIHIWEMLKAQYNLTIQLGSHVRKWSRCSARIYESKRMVD